jgi:hypothetical protein
VISPAANNSLRGWLALGAAILLLNASLSFQNLWPTPAIQWRGTLSLEFAVTLLLLAFVRLRTVWIRILSIVWVLLVFGRYADVTAPALYGRDINLYWDARFMPDVAAMIVRVAPFWLIALIVIVAVLAVAAIYLIVAWGFGRIAAARQNAVQRFAIGLVASAMLTWAAVQFFGTYIPKKPEFTRTVIPTYARQLRLAIGGITSTTKVGPSPAMNADLSLVQGADVLLIFMESYGAVTFDRPELARQLAPARAEFESAVHASGRQLVSAFVESTTFGGSSWLAHISLLSGVEVRDHETNAALMHEKRDTLATVFQRRGYRTIALMPGLKLPWPEGSFYGFDQTYNAERIDYPGPEFGWFDVPDQYSLAWLDDAELAKGGRRPVFLFFPTLSTHFPFSPTPPYQPDWARMLSPKQYDVPELVQAYSDELDWVDFQPAYVKAMAYSYAVLAGYLRLTEGRDQVLILVGDHQPPSAVTGEGQPWDVPVHVIASRAAVLERLKDRGFTPHLTPARTPVARMDRLLPILLDSFGGRH